MTMQHDRRFTEDYIDPDKRSIANSVQVRFKDGSSTENVTVEYPVGHRRRRQEAKPLLVDKFRANLSTQLDEVRVGGLVNLFSDQSTLGLMAVDELIDMLVPAGD
jgi:2-methylcitrate dehydratase